MSTQPIPFPEKRSHRRIEELKRLNQMNSFDEVGSNRVLDSDGDIAATY